MNHKLLTKFVFSGMQKNKKTLIPYLLAGTMTVMIYYILQSLAHCPYIYKDGTSSHKKSKEFINRISKNDTAQNKAMLLANSKVVLIFKKYGWKWGGDWKNIKDYQHFQK